MPFREALGLSQGNHAQVPVAALTGFPVKKPCRSVSTVFLPVGPLIGRRQDSAHRPAKLDPLYLFYCGVKWHKCGETGSGWELVQAMRSNNRGARALAAELLAETEDGRLLVRDLRRTRSGLSLLSLPGTANSGTGRINKGEDMITPYGLPIVEDCAEEKELVLPPLERSAQLLQRFQPPGYISGRRNSFYRRTDATRRFRALLGKGKAFNHVEGRESSDLEDCRTWRSDGIKRGDL